MSEQRPSTRTTWMVSLALALVWIPVLGGAPLNWDDGTWLGDPILGQPLTTALEGAFGTVLDRSWYPLLRLSFWLEYELAGPGGPLSHALNLGMFAGCAALLLRLLLHLGLGQDLAILTTLLWGLHPLRVESVAWITGRKDLLSLLLCLGAALLLVPSRPAEVSGKARLWATVLFAAALLVKSLVAPLAALLWVLVWSRRGARAAWRSCGGLLVLAVADAAAAGLVLESGAGTPPRPGEGLLENLAISLHFAGLWLQHTVLPVGLAAIYPLPEQPWRLGLPALFILGAGAVVAAHEGRRGRRARVLLASTWFLPLLPVCGLVPLAFWGADRWLLVSSLAIILPVAALLERFRARAPRAGLAVVLLLLVGLAGASRSRMVEWQTSTSLWEADAQRAGTHWARALNLGGAYGGEGRFGEALVALQDAERLRPGDDSIRAHRMFAELATGELDTPRRQAIALLAPPPSSSSQWVAAGIALLEAEEPRLASEAFATAEEAGSHGLQSSLGGAVAARRAGTSRPEGLDSLVAAIDVDQLARAAVCPWLAELEYWELTTRCVEARREAGEAILADELAAALAHHELRQDAGREDALRRAAALQPGLRPAALRARLPSRTVVAPAISAKAADPEESP